MSGGDKEQKCGKTANSTQAETRPSLKLGIKGTTPKIGPFNVSMSGRTAVRWAGIPKVARSRLTQCSKSCDLQLSPHCSVQYVELRVYCSVGGATSQLDLPALTPFPVAGCG